VLTDDQRADLATAGVAQLPEVVGRATADAMADRVWAMLARRGVDRADRSTWPASSPLKSRDLRNGGVFDAFGTPELLAVVAQVLGGTGWYTQDHWGPALITFPQPGPWVLPHKVWHLDLPGRGDPDRIGVARCFGFASDVDPTGGGTLVVEGSHELVRRMVAAAPGHDAGNSADLRKRLATHPWFRALAAEGGDRRARFMDDGDEIDGVRVRVRELTGRAGDVALMLPWTMHNSSMNCTDAPRFMVTHSFYGEAHDWHRAEVE
jgi:ectoine hydroxylase-related dioxygenase (phytanoyl-CoA dioxygenase family)